MGEQFPEHVVCTIFLTQMVDKNPGKRPLIFVIILVKINFVMINLHRILIYRLISSGLWTVTIANSSSFIHFPRYMTVFDISGFLWKISKMSIRWDYLAKLSYLIVLITPYTSVWSSALRCQDSTSLSITKVIVGLIFLELFCSSFRNLVLKTFVTVIPLWIDLGKKIPSL